jgi:N-acetylglucosamine kinase-like BadF-type ATPase
MQDPGSAAEIGRECLCLLLDNAAPTSSEFESAVFSVFGVKDISRLVSGLYSSRTPAACLAKLARPAAAEALRGNEAVRSLLEGEMRSLAAMADRHISRFGPQQGTISLALAGGLWRSHSIYPKLFTKAITELMPSRNIQSFVQTTPPVEGAVILAREMLVGN